MTKQSGRITASVVACEKPCFAVRGSSIILALGLATLGLAACGVDPQGAGGEGAPATSESSSGSLPPYLDLVGRAKDNTAFRGTRRFRLVQGQSVMEVLEGAQNLSPRSDVEQVYLADRPANFRLSCRTSVNGDVTVRTRPSNAVGKGSNSLLGALKSLIGK